MPGCLQEQAEMRAAGYEPELLLEAGRLGLEAVDGLIRRLPPPDWVQGQVRRGHQTLLAGTTCP